MAIIYDCVICGYKVSRAKSWMSEFRAVYLSSEGTFISGVGQYNDSDDAMWIAPSHPARRWDDPGYKFPDSDEFAVMSSKPENGRHGYVLHDACWCLLEKAFEPCKVPLERLYEVCSSVPFPFMGSGVCWGHNYGGLAAYDSQNHFPWEDQTTGEYSCSKIARIASVNPYDLPKINKMLKISHQIPQKIKLVLPKKDCFSVIPWEILEAIAATLPTRDALNLRKSSGSFLPLLTSQRFWASRFECGGERDYIFEARYNKKSIDWITLYRITNQVHRLPGLKNRRRIWELIQKLITILHLRKGCNSESSCIDLGFSRLQWSKAAGDIYEYKETGSTISGVGSTTVVRAGTKFQHGCQIFQEQFTFMPNGLCKIAFSITTMGMSDCVAGMRFIFSNGTESCFGYISRDYEHVLEIITVKGFILAIGSRGIKALQVVDGEGRASRWFGCPKDTPVTKRLASFDSICALKVGIDGYKMTSLAIAELELPNLQHPTLKDISLRATALWYPTIPSPELYLNDESFTGESPLTAEYQPLFWTHFGGPNGIYLRSLTEISATSTRDLDSIEFQYDTEDIPFEMRKLGRHHQREYQKITRFPIDGPGGEIIEAIDFGIEQATGPNIYSFYKHGKVTSLKITTNCGRSVQFGSSDDSLISLSISRGTTLTGLYASQHDHMGLISIGAISEVIENKVKRQKKC